MITQSDPPVTTENDDELGTLEFSEITAFVEKALSQNGERPLSEVQLVVLEASWLGQTYQQVADTTPFTKTYLQNDVAPLFWRMLSRVFGCSVDKRSFHSVVETLIREENEPKILMTETVSIGQPPSIDGFVGRDSDLQHLSHLISENRCILIVGTPGIGKSSLVAKLFEQQKALGEFEYLVFKYCFGSPAADCEDLRQMLGLKQSEEIIPYLREHRCLICFDEIDLWLSQDYAEVERFIRHYTDVQHDSVFLFTSREPIDSIDRLSTKRPVKTVLIEGLNLTESQLLIKEYDLNTINAKDLHRKFDGNPMYLRQALSNVLSLYGDEFNRYGDLKTSIAGNLYRENLDSIFFSENLKVGELERGVLSCLAKLSQDGPIHAGQATNQIVNLGQYSQSMVMSAIKTLAGLSLIKLDQSTKSPQIIVPHTVQKYIRLNLNNLFPLQQKQDIIS